MLFNDSVEIYFYCAITKTGLVIYMFALLRFIKRLVCLSVFFVGLFNILKSIFNILKKKGIAKTICKVEKTLTGNCVQYKVILWDKEFFSFQVG